MAEGTDAEVLFRTDESFDENVCASEGAVVEVDDGLQEIFEE